MKMRVFIAIFFIASNIFAYNCLSNYQVKFYKRMGLSDAEIAKMDKEKCSGKNKTDINKIKKKVVNIQVLNECGSTPLSYKSFLNDPQPGQCYKINYCKVFQKTSAYTALCSTLTDNVYLEYADKLMENHAYTVIGKYLGNYSYTTVKNYPVTVAKFQVVYSELLY